jgi:cyclophilin family peptidyl-prolyl cis-trans isomerase
VPGDSTPSHLDGVHTVFGQVISGLEHVTAISEADTPNSTPQNDGSGDTPINEVRLIQVTVND